MMLDRAMIEALVPHAGAMCLIDEVQSHDDSRIVCASMRHLSLDNPLRRGGRLSAVHAIEFAAQAAALHMALRSGEDTQRSGMLVSVHGCRLHADTLSSVAQPLRIEARRTAMVGPLASYGFLVETSAGRVAEGRLGVHVGGP